MKSITDSSPKFKLDFLNTNNNNIVSHKSNTKNYIVGPAYISLNCYFKFFLKSSRKKKQRNKSEAVFGRKIEPEEFKLPKVNFLELDITNTMSVFTNTRRQS